jgi:hypothetical protein
LLAIEEKAQKRTEKVLDSLTGRAVGDICLEFLGTEVGERLGKDLVESRPEHDDKLGRF